MSSNASRPSGWGSASSSEGISDLQHNGVSLSDDHHPRLYPMYNKSISVMLRKCLCALPLDSADHHLLRFTLLPTVQETKASRQRSQVCSTCSRVPRASEKSCKSSHTDS